MNAGSTPAKATFWLLEASDSLSAQSRREPDGTGLGWFDGEGRPHISKQPIAAYEDRQFARRAREISSRTFIAHIRFASTGALEMKNTHPFEQDGRLFAHNGVIEDLPRLEEELGEARSLVKGDTDSERLFALITREAVARSGDVAAAIEAACTWVAENLPVFAVNLVLIVDGELWALRYPETHDLFVLEREPGAAMEHRSSHGTRVHSEEAATRPMVTVASERMDDHPGWAPLASGELLHVSTSLEVTKRVVLDRAPAHPLTLADLSDRARASQTKVAK
jgi:glutamine amidotransferase